MLDKVTGFNIGDEVVVIESGKSGLVSGFSETKEGFLVCVLFRGWGYHSYAPSLLKKANGEDVVTEHLFTKKEILDYLRFNRPEQFDDDNAMSGGYSEAIRLINKMGGEGSDVATAPRLTADEIFDKLIQFMTKRPNIGSVANMFFEKTVEQVAITLGLSEAQAKQIAEQEAVWQEDSPLTATKTRKKKEGL